MDKCMMDEFSVNYNAIDISHIVGINKYFMKKTNIL